MVSQAPDLRFSYSGISFGDSKPVRDFLVLIYCLLSFYVCVLVSRTRELEVVRDEAVNIFSETEGDLHYNRWIIMNPASMSENFFLNERYNDSFGHHPLLSFLSGILKVVNFVWIFCVLFFAIGVPSIVLLEMWKHPSVPMLSYSVIIFASVTLFWSFLVTVIYVVPLPYRDYTYVNYLQELMKIDPVEWQAEHKRFVAANPPRFYRFRAKLYRIRKVFAEIAKSLGKMIGISK